MKSKLWLAGVAALTMAALYLCIGFTPEAPLSLKEYPDWSSQSHDLRVPQTISETDCHIMVMVLKTKTHQTTDRHLVKNDQGSFNCPFSKFGFQHIELADIPGGYETAILPAGMLRRLGAKEFDKYERSVFVSKPRYSLFRTRFSIDYGNNATSHRCTYNRFTGTWRLERCELLYSVEF